MKFLLVLLLSASPVAAIETDAPLIFGSAAIDAATTSYTRSHHAPNAVVRDINPLCEDDVSCVMTQVAAGTVVLVVVKQQRASGHKTRARVIVWSWVGLKTAFAINNIRNAHRKH